MVNQSNLIHVYYNNYYLYDIVYYRISNTLPPLCCHDHLTLLQLHYHPSLFTMTTAPAVTNPITVATTTNNSFIIEQFIFIQFLSNT